MVALSPWHWRLISSSSNSAILIIGAPGEDASDGYSFYPEDRLVIFLCQKPPRRRVFVFEQ